MARDLTQAQRERRNAILDRLRIVEIATPRELHLYLASQKHTYVTVETVARDLRMMQDDGIVVRSPHPTAGHTWGNSRRIVHTGWSIGPSEVDGPVEA